MNRVLLQSITFGIALGGLLAAHTVSVAQSGSGWTTFEDSRGTLVQYPADVFPIAQSTSKGRKFVTEDGRATLEVYNGPNNLGESPAQILRRTFPQKRELLTYDRVAHNFFAISARHNNQILYRRCNFYGAKIHCIDLTYPINEKRAWDYAVTRISRSLRPL